MQTTIKQLIREVSDIAANHQQIKSFYYGEPLSIIKGRKVNFTSLWMNISVSSFDEKKTTFNIELFCMDRVNKDDRNKTDVENTTSRILRDIYNIVRFSTRWQDFGELVQQVQNQKYYDYTADRVTGWGQTISFNVWNTDCFADLPMGDYDFNQTIPIDVCDVLAIVKNSDNDTLATKLVSDADNVIDIPDITVTDSNGSTYQQASGTNVMCTPFTPCADATVENSNASYTNTVVSGGTLVLPDITVTDSNGSTYTQPSVTNVVCTPGGGSGDVTVNGDPFGTYTAPTTFDVPVINSASNPVGTVIFEDHVSIGDSEVSLNSFVITSIEAEQNVGIFVVDRAVNQVGGLLSGVNWQVLNPLKGNFQAGVGVLADYVMTAEDEGTYTTLTDDGASGTVTILINGGALVLPYTAVAGDVVSSSRSINTAAGWYKLN
jgi:hypothetical protein